MTLSDIRRWRLHFSTDTATMRLARISMFLSWKKVNLCFYIAQYPVRLDRSKRFTLFLPWQTCSFRHQLGFSRKHSSHAAIMRKQYSLTFPPLSIARYSFIQLCGLRRREENENDQTSKQQDTSLTSAQSLPNNTWRHCCEYNNLGLTVSSAVRFCKN